MYELMVKTDFAAAHRIEGHPGRCRFLHGHNWGVEVYFESSSLNAIGIAADFSELKAAVAEVISRLDHSYLNDLPEFSAVPSAENIARYIFERLKPYCQDGTRVSKVRIWENERCSAAYWERS